MLKKLIVLSCALCLVCAVAACSSSDGESDDMPVEQPSVAEEDEFMDEPADEEFEAEVVEEDGDADEAAE